MAFIVLPVGLTAQIASLIQTANADGNNEISQEERNALKQSVGQFYTAMVQMSDADFKTRLYDNGSGSVPDDSYFAGREGMTTFGQRHSFINRCLEDFIRDLPKISSNALLEFANTIQSSNKTPFYDGNWSGDGCQTEDLRGRDKWFDEFVTFGDDKLAISYSFYKNEKVSKGGLIGLQTCTVGQSQAEATTSP